MTSRCNPNTMTATQPEAQWPVYRRAARTVVVVDVVESVRLIEQNEEDTVRRWQAFVGEVVTQLLPQHGGRLVKSLGDGLMVEFAAVPSAIQCAIAMQSTIAKANQSRRRDECLYLRIGAHVADVIVDELDIYGSGVNLAARLTTLAGPGEIVVSAEVRDALTDGLDAEIEDLGDCYLKHVQQPVRVYRVGEPGDASVLGSAADPEALLPTVAVIPFRARVDDAEHAVLGEVLADEVIGGLSQSPHLHVISRLSTSAFRDRAASLPDISRPLGVRYVLSGSYHLVGAKVRLSIELADANTQRTLWAATLGALTNDVLAGDDPMVPQIVAEVGSAIVARELHRGATSPLPTLESCTLLMGATALMHRASFREFDRARQMLEHLADRHRRQPQAHAWLGKWHVLRVVQGWTLDKTRETQLAQASVQRALDADASCGLALAIGGLIQAYLKKDLAEARRHYEAALACNPNESLAWLFTSTLHSYQGEGALAGAAAQRALRLSPLDPLKYFFDSLAATAVLSSGDYEHAIELAQRSLKANRTHTSTYRSLAIAQVLGGHVDEARETVNALVKLEPELTVQGFIDRYPGQVSTQVQAYAQALRMAGLPA